MVALAAAHAARADFMATDLTPGGTDSAQAAAVTNGIQGGMVDVAGSNEAWLWNDSAPGMNLQPLASGNPDSSGVFAVAAGQAAGFVSYAGTRHAAVWTPGGATPFQLLPDAAYSSSQAEGIAAGVIVGAGTASGASHALLWTDVAQNPIDLNPAGYGQSVASGTDGVHVVGTADSGNSGVDHAALWDAATQTFMDIHPATGFAASNALSVSGNLIAGYALQDGTAVNPSTHAMLWTITNDGSTIAATDLNPAGFATSYAGATNGISEVGFGMDASGDAQALLWQGTPDALELSQFLPAGEFVSSEALGIDGAGDIVGIATDAGGDTHAVLWSPVSLVPEPASALLLAFPAMMLLPRRREGK
jgi:uncharacterized membrane protein